MEDAPAADAGAVRASGPPDVPATPEAEPQREWAPPTREFTAFVESLGDGASRHAGRAAGDGASSLHDAPPSAPGAGAGSSDARRDAPEAQPTPATPVEATAAGGASPTFLDADEGAPAFSGADEAAPASEEAGAGAAGDEARGRVARVREGTRARVERMKDEALVVLEEAPDDSGLRFVLAAAALFVIFVLFLVLSTTVLR